MRESTSFSNLHEQRTYALALAVVARGAVTARESAPLVLAVNLAKFPGLYDDFGH